MQKYVVSLHHNNNAKTYNDEKFTKKIDQLTEKIEMGFYTKSEAMFKLRELRSEVAEKFEEGSDKFMQCIYPLIDANEIAKSL